MVVDGQIYGGLAQGIGTALYEEMPFDADGQPLASTFADYLLPGPTEVPAPRARSHGDARALHRVRREGHRRGRRDRAAGGDRQCGQRRLAGARRRSAATRRSTPRRVLEAIAAAKRERAGRIRPGARVKPVDFDYAAPAAISTRRSSLLGRGRRVGQSAGRRPVARADAQPAAGRSRICSSISPASTSLRQVEREAGRHLLLGACVTHADIEDGARAGRHRGAHARASPRGIAYRAVRNRGTIGGSLTHADPAADWVSVLAALGARSIAARRERARARLAVEDFVLGALETSLEPGEMLVAVEVPRSSASARWGYYKICRKTGEFAHAIGAVSSIPSAGVCRAVIGATERVPLVLADARALFGGGAAGSLAIRPEAADATLRVQPA